MQACTINGLSVGEGLPVRLMGVINCSPESFFKGSYVNARGDEGEGPCHGRRRGRSRGRGCPCHGARVPAHLPITVEKDRMVRALSALKGSGITVSVDTIHPEVLETCLRYDIHAVNDISGLSDPKFAGLIRDSGLPAILMASRSVPGDAVGFAATLETLRLVVERCGEHGIREFILDPGIGRWVPGRTSGNDWDLVRHFGEFLSLGRPLLAAVSRKTFIGETLGRGPDERLAGSLAVTCLLATKGASMVRTHDVRETRDVLRVLSEVQGR